MEISGDFASGKLHVNSHVVNAPHQIDGYVVIGDFVILLLATAVDYTNEERDFELDSSQRNIVSIDRFGNVIWTVSDAPHESGHSGNIYYEYIFTLEGNLYARGVDKRLYEIDHKDGMVTRSFDSGILPVDDKQVPVDGWIVKVIEFKDKLLVYADSLYGFDKNGKELWRDEERRGKIFRDGDVLIEKRQRGPRTKEMYRLDPDTGERLAEIEAEPNYWGWEYVRDIPEEG